MKRSLLEAISPTAHSLLSSELFIVGYAWNDPVLGELDSRTVVDACDAETALRSFHSKHRHLKRVWLIHPETC